VVCFGRKRNDVVSCKWDKKITLKAEVDQCYVERTQNENSELALKIRAIEGFSCTNDVCKKLLPQSRFEEEMEDDDGLGRAAAKSFWARPA